MANPSTLGHLWLISAVGWVVAAPSWRTVPSLGESQAVSWSAISRPAVHSHILSGPMARHVMPPHDVQERARRGMVRNRIPTLVGQSRCTLTSLGPPGTVEYPPLYAESADQRADVPIPAPRSHLSRPRAESFPLVEEEPRSPLSPTRVGGSANHEPPGKPTPLTFSWDRATNGNAATTRRSSFRVSSTSTRRQPHSAPRLPQVEGRCLSLIRQAIANILGYRLRVL